MLDKAIANWKDEERRALVDAANAKTVADMDRIVLRLDAAVRDVALAAVAECWRDCTTLAAAEARLARQFGLSEGSEKGEG